MARFISTLILLGLCMQTYAAEVVKIFLKFDPPYQNTDLMKHPYTLVNPRDSIYIKCSHSGDMGVISHHYSLKEKNMNGTYYIYVNNRLASINRYKEGKRNGVFESFGSDGRRAIQHFKNGRLYGVYKSYNPSGKINQLIYTDTLTGINLGTYHYEDGSVSANYFNMGEIKMGSEHFDKNGILQLTKYTHKNQKTENTFNKGILNGEVTRVFEQGRLELTYEQNRVVKMMYFDFELQEYTCTYIADEE